MSSVEVVELTVPAQAAFFIARGISGWSLLPQTRLVSNAPVSRASPEEATLHWQIIDNNKFSAAVTTVIGADRKVALSINELLHLSNPFVGLC